jgi:hypothetical protein
MDVAARIGDAWRVVVPLATRLTLFMKKLLMLPKDRPPQPEREYGVWTKRIRSHAVSYP